MAGGGSGGGISGVAVAAVAAGALLVVAGVRDSDIRAALRDILSGKAPIGREPVAGLSVGGDLAGAAVAASERGAAIAAAARTWLDPPVPYKWAGTTRSGVDCSGLVYRCLQAAGVQVNRKTSYGYRLWSGAVDIPRGQCAPGDLVCYTGHIAVATGPDTMIHAARPGTNVVERSIYKGQGGPIIRRVK